MSESIKLGRTLLMENPSDEETIQELRNRTVNEVNTVLTNLEARITVLETAIGIPYTKATTLDARVTALEP